MNQYRVDGSLTVAIDHGFGNMKTANIVFSNGMTVYDTEPIMSRDHMFFDGKCYMLNQCINHMLLKKLMMMVFIFLRLHPLQRNLD